MITTKNAIIDLEFSETELNDFRKVGFLPTENKEEFLVRNLDLFYRSIFKLQKFGNVKSITFLRFVKNRNLFYGIYKLEK